MRSLKLAVLVALALGAAACILKSTQHTLYLEPDGSVVWTVVEEDVHSNEEDAAQRRQEECDWLAAAEAGDHDVARALALLGATPTVRVLRGERPFVAWTEARFPSLDELGHRLVEGLGLPARFEATAGPPGEGGVTLELDVAAAEGMDTSDNPLVDLLDGLENTRFVLPEGRFVTAEGFEISEDGRTARPLPAPKEVVDAKTGVVRWALRWSTTDEPRHPDQEGGAEPPPDDPAASVGHDAMTASGRGLPAS